ncbi:hypothetical protein [Xenorhabdus poinarii]|uniref:hypothetical protein n=1 Tax=Xenorhabdus poinarii TaxID=40577 RepID=UPI0012FEA59F|nr:hypothetical protein [Xenorhabdus poinarii]
MERRREIVTVAWRLCTREQHMGVKRRKGQRAAVAKPQQRSVPVFSTVPRFGTVSRNPVRSCIHVISKGTQRPTRLSSGILNWR